MLVPVSSQHAVQACLWENRQLYGPADKLLLRHTDHMWWQGKQMKREDPDKPAQAFQEELLNTAESPRTLVQRHKQSVKYQQAIANGGRPRSRPPMPPQEGCKSAKAAKRNLSCERVYTCKCSKPFFSLEDLQSHIRDARVAEMGRFRCACGKRFKHARARTACRRRGCTGSRASEQAP